MNRETVLRADRVTSVPKQTRPNMVVKTFRIQESVWADVIARCEAEGVNPTDVIRDHLTAWAAATTQ